jgi:hypothetical protein
MRSGVAPAGLFPRTGGRRRGTVVGDLALPGLTEGIREAITRYAQPGVAQALLGAMALAAHRATDPPAPVSGQRPGRGFPV